MINLAQAFSDQHYLIASFGSDSDHESDYFLLDKDGKADSIEGVMRNFVDRFSKLRIHDDAKVIVHHEHRAYIKPPLHALHILFYPSREHLELWELPSLIAYISLAASFIQGDGSFFKQNVDLYTQRKINSNPSNLFSFQQFSYDKIATDSLVYALSEAEFYPLSLIGENLRYVVRFTLAEYFLAMGIVPIGPCAWSWETVIQTTQLQFSSMKMIIRMLEEGMAHAPLESHERAIGDLLEYFWLRDKLMK